MDNTYEQGVAGMNKDRLCLDEVRRDYRLLDANDATAFANGRVVTCTDFSGPTAAGLAIDYLPQAKSGWARFVPVLPDLLYAIRLLWRAGTKDTILMDGATRASKIAGFLNYLLPVRRRKILLWHPFCENNSSLKRLFTRCAYRGYSLIIVWSRWQIHSHAEYLGLPDDRFIFLPYKANHSKSAPLEVPIGNYIFAGGNSRRDYRTLFEAVAGTRIPLIVSVTDASVVAGLAVPENVIVLRAVEPAFARLTAGCRFAVIAIKGGIVRGAGEANICNAMWHGKPVIAADQATASDYIADGETGFVVAPGDVPALRKRVIALWEDPGLCQTMGRRAHERVAGLFTHQHFLRRIARLASLAGPELGLWPR